MSYAKLDPQPGPRAETLGYDDLGPGLYPGETALLLDGDSLVAVSVEPRWLENGAGIVITACARAIEEDGSTKLSPQGQHIETTFTDTRTAPEVEAFGVPALAKEYLLLLLGEAPTTVTRTNPEPRAEGVPETFDAPMIAWSDEVRLNSSIRHALTSVAGVIDAVDPSALLGLD